jgi:hypothetical protein
VIGSHPWTCSCQAINPAFDDTCRVCFLPNPSPQFRVARDRPPLPPLREGLKRQAVVFGVAERFPGLAGDGVQWVCRDCFSINAPETLACSLCSGANPKREKEAVEFDGADPKLSATLVPWVCSHCLSITKASLTVCFVCHHPRFGGKSVLPGSPPKRAPFTSLVPKPPWMCLQCLKPNAFSSTGCGTCGRTKVHHVYDEALTLMQSCKSPTPDIRTQSNLPSQRSKRVCRGRTLWAMLLR